MEETYTMQEEEILHRIKKHLLVYCEDFFIHGFAGWTIVACLYFLNDTTGIIGNTLSLILLMCWLIFVTSFFYAWTKDYFDKWDITSIHIIAINQKSLLEREVSYMEYSRIQDVHFEKNGLLENFFGYGTLRIQTAGSEQEFIINGVADVEEAAKRIIEMRDTKKVETVV